MTATDHDTAQTIPLRPPELVMKLDRLGAAHQTRLSFLRALLRRLHNEQWQFERSRWEIDKDGVGVAVYEAQGVDRVYSLVCFSHDLDPSMRTDRVIAEAWDGTFTLFDGVPDDEDIARLSENTPGQEVGRFLDSDLILSRVNRSARLFEYVVGELAAGRQPDAARLDEVGYLMRTTAVYGNGKFGMADRDRIAERPEFAGPFRAEMLTVWLIRQFTTDLTEYVAATRAPTTAVRLDPALRRRLGVGNSTGLGLGPFIINHPTLFDRWLTARETALARVRSLPEVSPESGARFLELVERATLDCQDWKVEDKRQAKLIDGLQQDLSKLAAQLGAERTPGERPWDALYCWGEETLSLEGQELLVSLMIEPHGDIVDELADTMAIDEGERFRIDGSMTIGDLKQLIEDRYSWAIKTDYTAPSAQARFWYVSENKLEPRLGERANEPGVELEQPLAIGRDVAVLYAALASSDSDDRLAGFLLRHPEHRHTARRVQIAGQFPYAEIQDNLIDADLLPLNLLRCKLAFFGANKFDPKSDRWLRINMFQNAPFPDEFYDMPPDDWAYPQLDPQAGGA
jgi:hypothetical protein